MLDRWIDGQTHGLTDRQTDGWTDRQHSHAAPTLCSSPSSPSPSCRAPRRCHAPPPRVSPGTGALLGAGTGGGAAMGGAGRAKGHHHRVGATVCRAATAPPATAPARGGSAGAWPQGSVSQRTLAPLALRATGSPRRSPGCPAGPFPGAGRSDRASRARPAPRRAGKSRSGLALKGGTEPRSRRLPSSVACPSPARTWGPGGRAMSVLTLSIAGLGAAAGEDAHGRRCR